MKALPLLVPFLASAAFTQPAVFWASDPISPGSTALVTGAGFGAKPTAEIARLPDTPSSEPRPAAAWPAKMDPVAVIQPADSSVKFVVPETLKPGLFAYRITGPQGAVRGLLNRPAIWWAQGDLILNASPGGWVRVFGKNLASPAPAGAKSRLFLRGPKSLPLAAEGDGYSARAALPTDLPTGEYQVSAHSGLGGDLAWSEPVKLTVEKPPGWPQTPFNVKQFGAVGDGRADDTVAVQAALKQAEANGGGVVYFPRGRYQLNATLNIPTRTVLRGEREDLVELFWGDGSDAWKRTVTNRLPCVIRGTHDFGLEDLMLWFVAANNGVLADEKGDAAGNLFLRRVRMQWILYGGYLDIVEANEVFKQTALDGGAGAKGQLLKTGGRNIEISDCDFESSGCVWILEGVRGARLVNNRFRIGRLGYCFVDGCERCTIENNDFAGADNMARSAVFFSSHLDRPVTSRIYFARNKHSNIWGWDRECNSTDGASGMYFGAVASATPTVVTVPQAQTWRPNQLAGHTLYVIGGRGKGQYRRVVGNTETTLTVDEPFAAPPDATSVIGVNHTMDRFLVIGNEYDNVRIAFQFYGLGMESIVAHNRAARSGGFWSHASHYAGPPQKGSQPQFYLQYIDNHLTEGNYVHAVPAGYEYGDGDSVIGVGAHPSTNPDGSPWHYPMAIGIVIRDNRLDSNARIRALADANAAAPLLEDAVIEGNHLARSDWGIDVSANTARVFLRNNTFDQVRRPLSGDGLAATGLHPAAVLASEMETLRTLARERFGEPPPWQRIDAEVQRLEKLPASDPALPGACLQTTRLAWQELARWRPTGYSMELLDVLSGLKLRECGWQKSTLHRLLHEGRGGQGEWAIVATLPAGSAPLTLELTPQWPADWQVPAPTVSAPLKPGEETALPLVATVPAGTWGPYSVPMKVRVSGKGLPAVEGKTEFVVGGGVVLDLAAVGPFPNRDAKPVDDYVHPPESRLDLAAGYDGLGGKIRWQTIRSRGIDFASLWKPAAPATAYVLTCLRATENVRASIMVACDGGLRAWLNGDEIAGFRGAAGTVPVDLKAGDNMLLLKISSTATGKWSLAFVNADEIGTHVGGRIKVVPADELKSLPALNPPPLPPPTPGALGHPEGVAWRLVHQDDFEQGNLADHWRVASGTWKMTGGVLVGQGPRAFLCLAQALPAPLRIEYDARSLEPGDLSAFHLDDPPDWERGCLIGFASNNNTLNKIMLDGEQVADSDKPLAVAGKWQHVIAQILPDRRVQFFVDDRLALETSLPSLSTKPRFAGLWTWATAEFDNVRIYLG